MDEQPEIQFKTTQESKSMRIAGPVRVAFSRYWGACDVLKRKFDEGEITAQQLIDATDALRITTRAPVKRHIRALCRLEGTLPTLAGNKPLDSR